MNNVMGNTMTTATPVKLNYNPLERATSNKLYLTATRAYFEALSTWECPDCCEQAHECICGMDD